MTLAENKPQVNYVEPTTLENSSEFIPKTKINIYISMSLKCIKNTYITIIL